MQNLNGMLSLGMLAGVWNCNRLCGGVQLEPFAGVSFYAEEKVAQKSLGSTGVCGAI